MALNNKNNSINGKILLITIVLMFLIFMPNVYAQSTPNLYYTFKVSNNGETTTFISIEGEGTINIPLPSDVRIPEIRGGIYILTENGIEVSIGETDKAVIAYKTSHYTNKEEGLWYFNADLNSNSQANILLPTDVQVVSVQPNTYIKKSDYVKLNWETVPTNKVSASYIFINDGGLVSEFDDLENSNSGNYTWIYILAIIIITLIAGLLIGYFILKNKKEVDSVEKESNQDVKKEDDFVVKESTNKETDNDKKSEPKKTGKPNITEGQMNVIRAANSNDADILTTLIKHNGHIKRNVLEKELGIAKSSLASSLKNLEKKNMVHIDRSFHVHYISLSKWFKELK